MKSISDINAIKEQMQARMMARDSSATDQEIRVVVGMATCGIAAGARPVLNTLVDEVAKENLTDNVTVTQTGCIGICQYEPVVEVYEPGKDKVTYVKMDAEKAKKVVEQHLKGGKVVTEYTIGQ